MLATGVQAAVPTTYYVDRSWSTATLIGPLEIPMGNYIIQNQGPSPFTSVNLTLTVNGTPYAVNNVHTDLIYGTGAFTIDAGPIALIFDASGDGSNPADLVFSDSPINIDNRYAIGANGDPGFEIGFTDAGSVVQTGLTFPLTFAVVPEPTTFALLGVVSLALVMARRRR